MDTTTILGDVGAVWAGDIVPTLHDYIAIPSAVAGLRRGLGRATATWPSAVDLVAGWCRGRAIAGMTVEVVELPGRTPVIVIEVPAFGGGAGRRHRPALRPPGQAAGDARLAGGPGAVDAGGRGRPALRPGRRRRRVRGVRRPSPPSRPCSGPAAPTPAASCSIEASEESGSPDLPAHLEALAGRARARRRSCCASTPGAPTTSGCGSRRRCGAGRRHAHRRHPGRGRALRRGQRRRAEHVPHRPPAARPHRGRQHRRDPPRRARTSPIPDDRRRQAAETAADTSPYSDRYHFVPGAGPVVRRPGRADPQPARGGRRCPSSAPTACPRPPGGQRAAADHRAPALVPAAADVRRRRRARRGRRRPHRRPALRRPGDVRGPGGRPGLERAAVRAVAGRRRCSGRPRPRSAARPARSARAARSRSWGCSASSSPKPSSSSPACSGRTATPTAPTSTSTCRAPSGSPPRSAMVLDDHARR